MKNYNSLPIIGFILMAVYRLIFVSALLFEYFNIKLNYIYFNIIKDELNKSDKELGINSSKKRKLI